MAWEYVASSALSAGSDLMFCIKGNSIYRPGGIATFGLGVTTNPVGYARMYTQYKLAHVIRSKIQIEAWGFSGTLGGGVPTGGVVSVPFRLAIVPAQSTAATAYASLPSASIGGLPHSTSSFSNNVVRTACRGNSGELLTGVGKHSDAETVCGDYSAATGGDPAAPWYYTVGLGNASSAINCTNYELRVRVTYLVRWYEPVDQAAQLAQVDRFGNESSEEEKKYTPEKGYEMVELKSFAQHGAGVRPVTVIAGPPPTPQRR